MLSFNSFLVLSSPVIGIAAVIVARRIVPDVPRLIFTAVFAIYILKALDVAFFPVPVDGVMAKQFAGVGVLDVANFVPLRRLFETGPTTTDYLNVLLGVPLGLGSFFVFRRSTPVKVLLFGALASAAVEILQVGIGLLVRVPYRTFDVDDLALNTAGVAIGVATFLVASRLYNMLDHSGGEGDSLGLFISNALNRTGPFRGGENASSADGRSPRSLAATGPDEHQTWLGETRQGSAGLREPDPSARW